MKWSPFSVRLDSVNPLPYTWDRDYYREVGRRVDQLVLMGYESAIPFANLYIKFVGWQTGQVLDALRDYPQCRVLVGLPTYSGERLTFHASAENVGSGLQGVIEGVRDLRRSGDMPSNFAGVALFAEWSTSPDEWSLYDRVWHSGSGSE
jgi:hypothetical protein